MKVILVFTGKTTEDYLKQGIQLYADRLKHYLQLEIKELIPGKFSNSMDSSQIRLLESEWLIKSLPAYDYLVLLDESGKSLSSASLSEFIQVRMNQGIRKLVFLIGGAYGVSDDLKAKANFILSLSAMTFTHQMIRLILSEQIYRAMTIIKREHYHNI